MDVLVWGWGNGIGKGKGVCENVRGAWVGGDAGGGFVENGDGGGIGGVRLGSSSSS